MKNRWRLATWQSKMPYKERENHLRGNGPLPRLICGCYWFHTIPLIFFLNQLVVSCELSICQNSSNQKPLSFVLHGFQTPHSSPIFHQSVALVASWYFPHGFMVPPELPLDNIIPGEGQDLSGRTSDFNRYMSQCT